MAWTDHNSPVGGVLLASLEPLALDNIFYVILETPTQSLSIHRQTLYVMEKR